MPRAAGETSHGSGGISTGPGRADFRADPAQLLQGLLASGYEELAVSGRHAAQVTHLPALHSDPIDRMLVARARAEGLTLLTADDQVAQYRTPIQRV